MTLDGDRLAHLSCFFLQVSVEICSGQSGCGEIAHPFGLSEPTEPQVQSGTSLGFQALKQKNELLGSLHGKVVKVLLEETPAD